jgi:hypothetical protein
VESSDPAYSVAFNRAARKLNTHLHYVDVGEDFRTELGFVRRTDIRDAHGDVRYSFWPEGRRLISWTPSLFVQRVADHDGLRLDAVVNPSVEWEFRRQTGVELFGSSGRARLRPQDYASLDAPRDYEVSEVGLELGTRFVASVDASVRHQLGRTVNFAPAAGAMPEPADRSGTRAELTLRPLDRVRVEGTFLYTTLEDRASGAEIFTDQILRIRLDTQFTRRLSLRVILQNERTSADPALTTVPQRRNWNGDVLLTYLVNPWTAFYVGYNGNYRRSPLDDGSGTPAPAFDEGYDNDASQVFVKATFLFRP